MRTCCGCGKQFDQRSLIRLQVETQTQCVRPVWTKKSGRSSWVCVDSKCIQHLLNTPKRFYRSLRYLPSIEGLESAIVTWLHSQICTNLHRLKIDGVLITTEKSATLDPTLRSPMSPLKINGPHKRIQTTTQLIQVYNELIKVDKSNLISV